MLKGKRNTYNFYFNSNNYILLSLKTKYVLGDEIDYDDDEKGSGDGVSDVFKHFENIKNSGKKKKNELLKSQEEKGKKDEYSKDDTDRSF